jgi:hypothetical protein
MKLDEHVASQMRPGIRQGCPYMTIQWVNLTAIK